MKIINELNQPTNTTPPPSVPAQNTPPMNQEMIVRTSVEDDKLFSEKNILISLMIIGLMIMGIAGGLYLVQREAIFNSKANSGWIIRDTNIDICEDKDCVLPGDLNYCPTPEGFALTPDSCIGQGAIDINCSDGIMGYVYHCPDQNDGDCLENKKYIGTFKSGQTISPEAMASQYECGVIRLEFNSTSESSIPGACGIIFLQDIRCTTRVTTSS